MQLSGEIELERVNDIHCFFSRASRKGNGSQPATKEVSKELNYQIRPSPLSLRTLDSMSKDAIFIVEYNKNTAIGDT